MVALGAKFSGCERKGQLILREITSTRFRVIARKLLGRMLFGKKKSTKPKILESCQQKCIIIEQAKGIIRVQSRGDKEQWLARNLYHS